MIDLSVLNDNQKEAVTWGKGALLVLAGPGSGKTKVLTLRIARLVEESPDARFRILGLTFTTKAAAEMRQRIDSLVTTGRERVHLATFHSFAADMLRQHGSHVGLRPDFTILNQEVDREAVLLDVIRQLKKDGHEVDESDVRLLPLIDKVFGHCIEETSIAKEADDPAFGAKLQAVFSAYLQTLLADNRLDFGALLYLAERLLRSRPRVARQIRQVYSHVCVDEFQDTNLAQCKLLRAIVGDSSANLFVVADDDQIIYQWNGASPERLQELRTDFKMDVVQLPANYRCPPEVIHLANALIQHHHGRMDGKLPLVAIRKSDNKERVRLHNFEGFDDELSWVATDILARPAKDRASCTVLARATKLLKQAVETFAGDNLPAYLAVRKDEFTSVPMRWMHAMLRLANARQDREQLRIVCRSFHQLEGIGIRPEDVTAEAAAGDGDCLRTWCESVLRRAEVETATRSMLGKVRDKLIDRLDYNAFLSDAFSWLAAVGSKERAAEEEAFSEFDDERKVFQQLIDDARREYDSDLSLHVLLQSLDLSSKTPPPPAQAVRCMTVHAAKGLEFKHVYLIGLAEDMFPSFQAVKQARTNPQCAEIQEETRNCFVAITRTQETLTLTYSSRYFGWAKEPSRFLTQMGLLAVDEE